VTMSAAAASPLVHAFRGDAPYCFFMRSPLLFVPLHIWRGHVLKTFGLALLLASGLAVAGAPARALQIVVTQVDKSTDGSMTYHFAVKTDQGETLTPGESKETSDFVTVYNFYGLVDGREIAGGLGILVRGVRPNPVLEWIPPCIAGGCPGYT
jgi:hypothetical protein